MRKILAVGASLSFLMGCANNNQITIVNDAQESIYFNFRASETIVANGTSTVIKNIPNGSYSYNTTYELPAGATSWTVSGNAGGGSLRFAQENTHQLLIYSSTLVNGVYTLYINGTSTDSTGATSILLGP